MSPFQLQLEINSGQVNDFHQFLSYHKKISSFQKTDSFFTISLLSQTKEEYHAFLQGIKEAFQIKQLKETRLCQAKCRDNTSCLNPAKYDDFCWRHKTPG